MDDGPERNSGAAYKSAAKPLAFTDRTREMPPRLAREGIASADGCPPTTLCALFKQVVEKKGDLPALLVERPLPPRADAVPVSLTQPPTSEARDRPRTSKFRVTMARRLLSAE